MLKSCCIFLLSLTVLDWVNAILDWLCRDPHLCTYQLVVFPDLQMTHLKSRSPWKLKKKKVTRFVHISILIIFTHIVILDITKTHLVNFKLRPGLKLHNWSHQKFIWLFDKSLEIALILRMDCFWNKIHDIATFHGFAFKSAAFHTMMLKYITISNSMQCHVNYI